MKAGHPTPLTEAVLRQNQTLVELLLFWGADPNATVSLPVPRGPQGRGGFTALHIAAHRALVPIMSLLLKNGASVKTRDSLGRTPLHWAAEAGHLNPKSPKKEVVSLLLEHGGDLDQKDLTGLSAPALAREVAGEPPPSPEIKTRPAPAAKTVSPPAPKPPVKPPPVVKKPAPPPTPKPPPVVEKPVAKPAPSTPTPVVKPMAVKPAAKPPAEKPAIAKPAAKPTAPAASKPALRWVRVTRTAVRLRSAPTTQGGDTGQRVSTPARLKLLAVVTGKHTPKEVWYQVIDPTGKAAFLRSDMAERVDTPAASAPPLRPTSRPPATPPASPKPVVEELPHPLPAFSDSVLVPFSYSLALPPHRPVGARPMATLKNRPLRPRSHPAPGAPVVWGSKLPQGQAVRALRVHREKNQPTAFWVEVLSPTRGSVFLPEAAFVELPWFVSAQDPRTKEDKLFLLAARRGKLALAKKWFQAGANPDAAEPGAAWETPYAGWTALHWAAEKNHPELAAWLLSLGAHTNTPDAEGRLPLTLARWRGHNQLADLLKP